MYHGLHELKFNIYVDKSLASGWRYQMLHRYTCEHCGHEHNVLFRATEDFYCSKCANRLVDVRNMTEEALRQETACECKGKLKYYTGALGYDALVCQTCGEHWDDRNIDDYLKHIERYRKGDRNGFDRKVG